MLHDFAAAGHVAGHQRAATGGRLDQRARHALTPGGQADDLRVGIDLRHVVALAEVVDDAFALPGGQGLRRHAVRVAGLAIAGDGEARVQPLRPQLARRCHEFGQAFLPQQTSYEEHPGGARRLWLRAKALHVHARAANDAGLAGGDQAALHEVIAVIGILEDGAGVGVAQQQPVAETDCAT